MNAVKNGDRVRMTLGAIELNQEDEGMWPRRDTDTRVLHGVAWPDPSFTEEDHPVYTVRYVGHDEADARDFAAQREGGIYVRAEQEIETTRDDWTVQP